MSYVAIFTIYRNPDGTYSFYSQSHDYRDCGIRGAKDLYAAMCNIRDRVGSEFIGVPVMFEMFKERVE